MTDQPITVRIPPEIYARANRYAYDVDGSPKAWFNVRDVIAKALYEQNLEMKIPEGWQLAPKEPTNAMMKAGEKQRNCKESFNLNDAFHVYVSMLKASPTK